MKVTDRDREAARYLIRVGVPDEQLACDIIAAARAEGRREALEEAARKAEDHCHHSTRLCATWEDTCQACLAARDIRSLAAHEEGGE